MEEVINESVQSAYQSLTGVEHVLKRPDTYVGALDTVMTPQYVVNMMRDDNAVVVKEREIGYIPAFERIFLEIISNAADNGVKTAMSGQNQGIIRVTITDSHIEVYNEGLPVPTDWHVKNKQWVPSMIFFNLRTGSNFDDDESRKWGGRNGFGAKLTAIFSTEFEITCHNTISGIRHYQRATNNMTIVEDPIRTEIPKEEGNSHTTIRFAPDFKRFYTANVENDHKASALTLTGDPSHCGACWDANNGSTTIGHMNIDTVEMFAALTFDFSFNNRIPIVFEYTSERFSIKKNFIFDARDPMNYVKTFMDTMPTTPPILFETQDGDNRVIFLDTPLNGFQRSFANGLPTREGGVHVNAWLNALTVGLKADLEKKAGVKKVKPGDKKKPSVISKLTSVQVAPHVTIFLSHYCINPKFGGQTKERLTAPPLKDIEIPDKLIREFSLWNAYTQIEKSMAAKDRAKQNKAVNPKRAKFVLIDGMDDAVWAGTDKSSECTGFVCEGKSAKTFFTKGLVNVKDARERLGCLPIKGKILNTAKATNTQLLESKVLENLVKFFGLQLDVDYSDPKVRKTLRYGKCVILVDADDDGIHIKILLVQFFSRYLNLLESGFLAARLTPVMVVTQNRTRRKFYSKSEYERWVLQTPDYGTYKAKYFKGLGSATDDIISETFTAPVEQRITCDEEDREILGLAMNTDSTDDRKELYRMLHNLPASERLDSCKIAAVQQIVFEELIQFAMAANERAIPAAMDGLKISYRQAIYTLLKAKKTGLQEMAVISGWVKSTTKYHHADNAMVETLVGLAQDFPGSNNMPLILGEGGYGSRLGGGKDHAAGRYLKGQISPIVRYIMRPEDDILLETVYEDGDSICVKTYYPILPLQLVNRCAGVGWGWSSDSPNYHPFDVIESIKAFIAHIKDGQTKRSFKTLLNLPWYRGYKGVVFRGKKGEVISRGYFKMEGYTCHVYDLPIGISGSQFEKKLAELQVEKKIEGFKNVTLDLNRPSYIIFGCAQPFTKHKGWLMETTIAESQCTYLDDKMLPINHIMGVNDVLIRWCTKRYPKYVDRKFYYLQKLKEEAAVLELKVKFIDDVIAEPPRFDIRSRDDKYIGDYMTSKGYPLEFLNVPYKSFSQKHVNEIKKKLQDLYERIDWYEKTHPGDLWNADLDELKAKLEEMYPGQWKKEHGYGFKSMDMPK